ncbi:YceI-like domain-containing protein [Salegentibacter echinorum]|uniref:YceI-like domain-containing protein n=1 Tax=Salegentibacter echinorum TaxID=1073325 RepID=A0A1M5E8X9_SALEC|nr:YceI family protein [Salegentibacter echinorum]SHF75635.1 YceI-like domain-containing protein [Salegentibacter echinorum]
MKTIFNILLFFTLGLSVQAQNIQTREVTILPNSSLSISGTTNINTFDCDFNVLSFKKQAFEVHYTDKDRVLHFKNSVLPLENKYFDCGNRKINKDFHKLLKTEEYPAIFLTVKKIDMSRGEDAVVTLSFTIAGIENDYKFPIEVSWENQLRFKGNLQLNIKDFNLEAPSKIFGLIVLEEEIEINFNLNIQT